MHYYQFNIPDWALHTAHLDPLEEGVYFRLCNHYYDTESPIPEETQSVFRRLRLGSHQEVAARILEEFFELEGGFWHHKRCEKEISAYHKKAKTNRENGAKGGRPKGSGKAKTQKKPKKTQPVNSGNPNKTLTINHKPLTSNQSSPPAIAEAREIHPDYIQMAERMWSRIQPLTKQAKPPNLETWADDIRKLVEIDNRPIGQVAEVFAWANADDFWATNVLSAQKLRKQFPVLVAKMGGVRHDYSRMAQEAGELID